MDEGKSSRKKLPQVFGLVRWFTMIERIFAAQEKQCGKRKSRGIAEQKCFKKVALLMKVLSVAPARYGLNRQTQLNTTTKEDHRRISDASSGFKDTASDVTGACFPNLHMYVDRDQIRWRLESETKPTSSSGNLAGDSVMDLSRFNYNPRWIMVSLLASYFKQRIEDALEPLLGPVAAACQSQGRDKSMKAQREKFLALEEKKLALRREKIQRLKRRRAGRFQPSRRASSSKSSRHRVRQGLRQGKPQGQFV